ncbi:MAG: hypothetical protein MRK01_06215 [Candidatus Scalindua sp.]|nr:hypothetical protein [Candidatus Scalindua sp.]
MIERNSMPEEVGGLERRLHRRLDLSLLILLPDQKAESKNISSAGVYFEMITDYRKRYHLGESVGFEIVAETTSTMLPMRTLRLSGSGKIIRKTLIHNGLYKKVWGIAVQFDERLAIVYDPVDFPHYA